MTQEIGIHYQHVAADAQVSPALTIFHYLRRHRSGFEDTAAVACRSRSEFEKLVAHWNTASWDWKYHTL